MKKRKSKGNPKEGWEEDLDDVKGHLLDAAEEVEGRGGILLNQEGYSEFESYFPFVPKENMKMLGDCTEKQKERRNRNMEYLLKKGIYVCELPLNKDEDSVLLRDKEEVVRRTLGVLVVSLYSEVMLDPQEAMSVPEARKFIGRVMREFAVEKPEEILTPAELSYINEETPDQRTQIEYSWNYEHLYMLEWILGLTEWNDPTEICDVALIVRNLRKFDSVEDICKKTTMRNPSEILDKADLIYRMDWAAVDARIHHMSGPAGLEHGVVQARHKTLNWMINFQGDAWDDVNTPT